LFHEVGSGGLDWDHCLTLVEGEGVLLEHIHEWEEVDDDSERGMFVVLD